MAARLRRFSLSPVAILLVLVLAAVIAPAMRLLEPDLGLPLLYLVRGERPAPPEAVVIGLDKAGVDWLAFNADRLEAEAPELAACLPPSVRATLARASNVEDLPRGLLGCLFQALAALEPQTVVVDIHFYGATDEINDGLLEQGLRRLTRPILLEKVQAAELGAAALRERPAARFRTAGQTGFFVVEWRDGDTYRYVTDQPDFADLRSLPSLAAEAAGLPAPALGELGDGFGLLNLYGSAGSVVTVAFLDVLTGQYRASLAGRTVFVGASNPKGIARRDAFETAWSSSSGGDVAGVELAATGMLNLLHGHSLWRLPPVGDAAVSAAAGFLILAVALCVSGLWAAVAAIGLGGLYFAGAAIAFSASAFWLPVAAIWYAYVPLAVLLAITLGYRQTSVVLFRLLPRPIALTLMQSRGRARAVALVTEATVMVLDLIGSTTLAESMEEAAYNRRMTAFFNLVNGSIQERGGMVLKYTGDGVLAVFDSAALGAAHASRALAAATQIAQALDGESASDAQLCVRIGINSGTIAMGEVGADTRSSVDAMGDAVNIAARLEQMAKDELMDSRVNQTTILAAETTITLAGDWLPRVLPIGRRTIRGRQGEVWVFRVDWRL